MRGNLEAYSRQRNDADTEARCNSLKNHKTYTFSSTSYT